MKLLIVESPNKIKKIKALLGSDWDRGFSLQRGEKLRQGSRYPDKQPQGEPLIREMA